MWKDRRTNKMGQTILNMYCSSLLLITNLYIDHFLKSGCLHANSKCGWMSAGFSIEHILKSEFCIQIWNAAVGWLVFI